MPSGLRFFFEISREIVFCELGQLKARELRWIGASKRVVRKF